MESAAAPAPAAATTTSKPNRSRRNNNHSKRRGKPRGPPPAPLLKLVLRNFTSLDDMVEQVPRLIEAAGAVMDVQQLKDHVMAEKEFAAATAAWKEKVQNGTHEEEEGKEEEEQHAEGEKPAGKETKKVEHGEKESQQNNKKGETSSPSLESTVPPGTLVVRVMYIVAPRVSRRRGSILGSVYIVLTVTANPDKADDRNAAQARLRLQSALDHLQGAVTSSTITIQEARSAKAWKDTRRFGNETGTIFDTADYKQWLETTTAATTELSARPKPVPGGVTPAAHAAAATTTAAPVAALVTYLQNKRSSERRQNKSSRNNNNNNAAASSAATKKRERNRRPRRKKRKPASTTTTSG